ncbi:unnamed protein product [Pleuronectes platessa]|uniref:Uncharacterized protein n=1 Tax=Pleuronectes platessa TaxID=8262 RepID=A0A9N7VR86_PLEPL|nr:unnamed protein product [Pleuronectes platessa]
MRDLVTGAASLAGRPRHSSAAELSVSFLGIPCVPRGPDETCYPSSEVWFSSELAAPFNPPMEGARRLSWPVKHCAVFIGHLKEPKDSRGHGGGWSRPIP